MSKDYIILILAFFLLLNIPAKSIAQDMTSEQKGIYNKSLKMFKKDNYADALNTLQVLIQSCPNNLDVNRYMGECLFFLNKPDEAIPYYEQAKLLIQGNGNNGSDDLSKKPYYRDLLDHIISRLSDCNAMISEKNAPIPEAERKTQQNTDTIESNKERVQNSGVTENETSSTHKQVGSIQLLVDNESGIIQDKTQNLKFKFYSDNPTSLTHFILENQDDSWKVPSENEVINFLKNLIESHLVEDPFFKLYLSPDSGPLISSDFEYDQGDKLFHCFYISGNEIRKINKESIEEVNILLKQ